MPDRSYSRTRPTGVTVLGIPATAFTATLMSAISYVVAVLTILGSDCPFNQNVIYFFVFLILALLAISFLFTSNLIYSGYRTNMLGLSVSLIYCGSCALLIFMLIHTASGGLCMPKGTPQGGVFQSKNVNNYVAWTMTAIGVPFQIAGHYYSG